MEDNPVHKGTNEKNWVIQLGISASRVRWEQLRAATCLTDDLLAVFGAIVEPQLDCNSHSTKAHAGELRLEGRVIREGRF